MSSDDEAMSASDQALMKALAEAIGRPRPPIDLAARCEGLLAWIDVDAELAELLDESAAEAAGTRGPAGSSTALQFTVADGSVVIEVTASDDALHGQLLGAEAHDVIVRGADGNTHSVPVDELGGFSLAHPQGAIRLEFELLVERRRIHTNWFVL